MHSFPHKGVILRDSAAAKHLLGPACRQSLPHLLSQATRTQSLAAQNREASQQEGCTVRTAGKGGTATTCTHQSVEPPLALLPHRISGKAFVFCSLFFPSQPTRCVLCQLLTPGIMHCVSLTTHAEQLACQWPRWASHWVSQQHPTAASTVPLLAAPYPGEPPGQFLFLTPRVQLPLLPPWSDTGRSQPLETSPTLSFEHQQSGSFHLGCTFNELRMRLRGCRQEGDNPCGLSAAVPRVSYCAGDHPWEEEGSPATHQLISAEPCRKQSNVPQQPKSTQESS